MSKARKKFDVKKWIVWTLTMLFSITAVFLGNRIVTSGLDLFIEGADVTVKAAVTDVVSEETNEIALGEGSYESRTIVFNCEIQSGDSKGESVTAEQIIDNMYAGSDYIKVVEPGDKIMIISAQTDMSGSVSWQFSDYYRFDKILILGLIFFGLILIIGRWKGVNTILSLAFTFSFVFLVFVPAVMNGYNAYVGAAITCVFTIVMTLLLINGAGRKTLATIIGCISGMVIAAAGTWIMSEVMHLTGFVDEHSYYLTMLNPENPVDLTSIVFAAIIIGALGALMDVAMDISSALYELSIQVPDITFGQMCRSGMNIGRDIMGTMANTLVLAYIGSSLSCIMILLTYSMSVEHLLNREVIIVEFLQALIGSTAILLTVPCTVLICGVLYIRKKQG